MPTCVNDDCRRKFVGESCPYCNKSKTKRRSRLVKSVFGTATQEYVSAEDFGSKTTIEVHGDYVQNTDNSSRSEIQVGGDYLQGNAIKASDSVILSKHSEPRQNQPEIGYKFCPYCSYSFETLAVEPKFCPSCGNQLRTG
jgi:hypothetical protein